jgi:KUP system potassium uptake protein
MSTGCQEPHHSLSAKKSLGLILAALGVVFGDIGTSPLYALRECFAGSSALALDQTNILGAASLIVWFLIVIVCVKYVGFIMRADNKGEGGVLALMALVERIGLTGRRKVLIGLVPTFGILGTALLFSDGIITPAISVLSAVEGLMVATPMLRPLIVPLAMIILTGLFVLQAKGTTRIGAIFGPIILVWFITIGILGMAAIVRNPAVLAALNPWYAGHVLVKNGWHGFALMGIAFLAVTGAEVLYADMGHFGRHPIRKAWFVIVFPSLVLNYLGQAAFLLQYKRVPENLFYLIAPQWFVVPLVMLATCATVIASQAVITGMFSLARQAVQLGFWPRLHIVHTSREAIGQVYLPFVNNALWAGTMLLIFLFKESGYLASAYGIAVSATMLITSLLALLIARHQWRVPLPALVAGGVFFVVLDTTLFAANVTKLFSGGMVVVLPAIAVVVMMTTWSKGRLRLRRSAEQLLIPMAAFVKDVVALAPLRVPGTAVFLSGNAGGIPRALLHNVKHNKMLHDRTVCLTVAMMEVPVIPEPERAVVTDLGQGFFQIVLRYGFMDMPNLPRDLANISMPDRMFTATPITYFLGKETLVFVKSRSMPLWRKKVFYYMSINAHAAAEYYELPANRVVELGLQVEL